MATRETQSRITNKAIELFNKHGTRAVSSNRIADECGISRGNLHYHFRTKEELIQTVFHQIDEEMNASWYDDHLHPTMRHMYLIFERQMRLIRDYRFFYRELTTLLQNDSHLKELFMRNRKKRSTEVEDFFRGLTDAGLIQTENLKIDMDSLLEGCWLITDQWLPHLDMNNLELNEQNIKRGSDLIYKIMQPIFTRQATEEYARLVEENELAGSVE